MYMYIYKSMPLLYVKCWKTMALNTHLFSMSCLHPQAQIHLQVQVGVIMRVH